MGNDTTRSEQIPFPSVKDMHALATMASAALGGPGAASIEYRRGGFPGADLTRGERRVMISRDEDAFPADRIDGFFVTLIDGPVNSRIHLYGVSRGDALDRIVEFLHKAEFTMWDWTANDARYSYEEDCWCGNEFENGMSCLH